MKKFYLETYGCQMNVSDSEMISKIMLGSGYAQAATIDDADIIMFNTCSVRQHAEDRVLGRITNEQSKKRARPHVKIGVIGCMAQRLGAELHKINKNIDFVVGVDNYQDLPNIIAGLDEQKFIVQTLVNNQEIYPGMYPQRTGINNAFVTIMRGCDNFCSYCIVPYTRGRERSRPIADILAEIKNAGEQGYADITLLGQNVNSYQYDTYNFAQLLSAATKLDSIRRLRFVTSHPKDLSDEVISVMAAEPKICPHLHLPMQSGNNEILKIMNRKYTVEHYMGLISKLRTAIPEIALSTDIITGFPGETEAQFNDTYELMQKIQFDTAFMFKYSPRSGTKAADFTNQIPEEIRLARLRKLIDMQSKITTLKYQAQIGNTKEIYVEKISRRNKHEVAGKAADFKIAVFPGTADDIGKFIRVKITAAVGWTLKGERI